MLMGQRADLASLLGRVSFYYLFILCVPYANFVIFNFQILFLSFSRFLLFISFWHLTTPSASLSVIFSSYDERYWRR